VPTWLKGGGSFETLGQHIEFPPGRHVLPFFVGFTGSPLDRSLQFAFGVDVSNPTVRPLLRKFASSTGFMPPRRRRDGRRSPGREGRADRGQPRPHHQPLPGEALAYNVVEDHDLRCSPRSSCTTLEHLVPLWWRLGSGTAKRTRLLGRSCGRTSAGSSSGSSLCATLHVLRDGGSDRANRSPRGGSGCFRPASAPRMGAARMATGLAAPASANDK